MKPILAKDILIKDNRQRREFYEAGIVELSESIQSKGLMHPIVCRYEGEATVLVAGERRLRAMLMLIELGIPIVCDEKCYLDGTVPVSYLGELDELSVYEAELEENILRKDLTWQEHDIAIAKLHELRTRQAELRNEVHLPIATAAEIAGGMPTAQDRKHVREALRISENLSLPEVAKATTRKEALKIIEKKEKEVHRAKLAEAFQQTKSPHTLILGDTFSLIEDIPKGSIDCIVTDPPYGINADNFGSNFDIEHEYNDDSSQFFKIADMLSVQIPRVLSQQGHAYIFCSIDGWIYLREALSSVGMHVWPWPMIWNKSTGNVPWVTFGHKHTYECILFACKEKRNLNLIKSDVITISPVSERNHGAEKPVELYVDLLNRSVVPGSKILDLFAGSGTIFSAADAVSCKATGFEINEKYYNVAKLRMENLL